MVAIGCQRESISIFKFHGSTKELKFLASDRVSRIPSVVKFLSPSIIIAGDKLGNIFGLTYIKTDKVLREHALDSYLEFKAQEPLVKLFCGTLEHRIHMHKSNESFWYESAVDEIKKLSVGTYISEAEEQKYSVYALGITGAVFQLKSISQTLFDKLSLFEMIICDHFNMKRTNNQSVVDKDLLLEFLNLEESIQAILVDKWNLKNQMLNGERRRASVSSIVHTLCLL